ncbi:unnamed protein product [Onchocerca flexuosa]|uniref:Shugoshin_C domain-containing protein n=1 Tax=Onchocerca flexuosa TaxID=387005 RepID=A0A183GZM6_9BILA|nr:unnamed protein product [Onchocerca flexuosa]
MAVAKTDGISSSLFEKLDNKLNTVRSNRSLVSSNQQLRIQLAFAKAEINRLQNEMVNLQRRIVELESSNDEERIEMIQRVQHLKSIANRAVQYMKKTEADFNHAASRLDYALNFGDVAVCTDECNESVSVPSAYETGDEIFGRHMQQPSILEAVEEDIYGEMDENEENIISDKHLIMSASGDRFKPDDRKFGRNSRRQTFFVKKEPYEFENDIETSFVEVAIPETNQMISSFSAQNDEDAQSLTELITPTTSFVSGTSTTFSNPETPTTCCSSRFSTPKTPHVKISPAKNSINSQIKKSEVVMYTRKKRRISTNETSERCKISSDNTKSPTEMNKLLTTPTSTPYTGLPNVINSSESARYKRVAAARISSFKEPNLKTKLRNSNVN